jgi:hypothetical protein
MTGFEGNNKCNFHKTTKWNDGQVDNICLFVKDSVECDGYSIEHLRRCPLWGKLE